MRRFKIKNTIISVVMILLAFLYVSPFYFLFINSFKSYDELMRSFMLLPHKITLQNYSTVWEVIMYPKAFLNTLIIVSATVVLAITISGSAGYKLERTASSRFSRLTYNYFLFGLIIPFFAILVPLMIIIKDLKLTNNYLSLILYYSGSYCSFGIFVFYGFSKSIPHEIDEAAVIDGCTPYRAFFKVVMPLLLPATATLAVLFVLWSWNDFPVSYIFLTERSIRTLSPALYYFVGPIHTEWQNLVAGVILCVTPILIFYVLAQKYIEKGLIIGALKG